MRIFLFSLIALVLYSCNESSTSTSTNSDNSTQLQQGVWRFSIENEYAEIPFLAKISTEDPATFTIINSDEDLSTQEVVIDSHTIKIELPVFAAELNGNIESPSLITGFFIRTDAQDYKLPFIAEAGKEFLFTNANTTTEVKDRYKVEFRPKTENSYPAILLLKQDSSNNLTGTFLTETGDYRYLSGNIMNGQIHLSGFSGASLYYFVADIAGDSLINGIFYSGKNSKSNWNGIYDKDFELKDANELTHLKETATTFNFHLPNQSGTTVSLDDLKPANTVAIVEIMGSWCPNCMDAAKTLKKFEEEYSNELVVIPIAFENTDDLEKARPRLEKMQNDLGISGNNFVFGGKATGENVLAKLPALQEFRSYPTLIFIDKNDSVRSIYTGFYGPGTGSYYDQFVQQTDSLLQLMISE